MDTLVQQLEMWRQQKEKRHTYRDKVEVPRTVEVFFSFRSQAGAAKATATLEELGFTVQSSRRFIRTEVIAKKNIPMTDDFVVPLIHDAASVAKGFGGKFDGFAGPVVE